MPYAVTHVLLTIILVDLFRDYFMKKRHKRYLTLHTIFIAGVAGLLPDMDIFLGWIFNSELLIHGGIFHTPLFGLIFLIPAIILWKQRKNKIAVYFFIITFGILFHIFLDYLLGGANHYGIMPFWPLSTMRFNINMLSMIGLKQVPMILDAVILLGWLWHEEIKHKIKDFI